MVNIHIYHDKAQLYFDLIKLLTCLSMVHCGVSVTRKSSSMINVSMLVQEFFPNTINVLFNLTQNQNLLPHDTKQEGF